MSDGCGNCEGPVDWEDDAPDICEDCYAMLRHESAKFEPPDDPQLESLLPDPESLPIDIYQAKRENVQRLVNSFAAMVDHIRETPRGAEMLTNADLLVAYEVLIRTYVQQMVTERIKLNPTAAVTNRVTIVHMLHTLIDEILMMDLPNPVKN